MEAVRTCDPGSFRVQDPAGLGAEGEYSVVGLVGESCKIALTFSKNPNAALVDKPLTFVVDPGDASEETLLSTLGRCLTGGDGVSQCVGPLFDQGAGAAPWRPTQVRCPAANPSSHRRHALSNAARRQMGLRGSQW